MSATVLLVGCGKMGRALLDGWLSSGSVDEVVVVEPAGPDFLPKDKRVRHANVAGDIEPGFSPSVVVFAVKPQAMDAVVPGYRGFVEKGAAILSIAAGTTIGYFQKALGSDAAIVRAMPNTPAAIGKGTTVLVAAGTANADQRALAETLMSAVGTVDWVEDEGLIDAVTALSGGGPAYVFLLVECLAEAGRAAGLPADLSLHLARNTVVGSGALLGQATESAATLRKNVTSPGGTTEAALRVMMDANEGIAPVLTKAIAAATARSRELAG